jgi:hypothetical protein
LNLNYEKEIRELESEWSPDDGGFFWHLRQGHFADDEFRRAHERIAAMTIASDKDVPLRLVSLLWFIPIFMQWQTERVRERGGDVTAYGKAIAVMTNEVQRLLGVP